MPDQRSDPGRVARHAAASPQTVELFTQCTAQRHPEHPGDRPAVNPRLVEAIELVVRLLERLRLPDAQADRVPEPPPSARADGPLAVRRPGA